MAVAGDHLGRRDRRSPSARRRAPRPPGRRSSTSRPRRTACTRRPSRGPRAAGSAVAVDCSAHSATLAPNVVGSAWMPWVRPIITVSRCRRASSTSVCSSAVAWRRAGGRRRRASPSTAPCRRRRTTSARSGSTSRPARRSLLDDVDERRDVVVGRALALGDRRDERLVDDRRPLAARRGVGAARRRAWRGPRSPAARPPASGRSGRVSDQTAAISGSGVALDHDHRPEQVVVALGADADDRTGMPTSARPAR